MGLQETPKKLPQELQETPRLGKFRAHRELVQTVYPLVGLWRICRVCHSPILEHGDRMVGYRFTDTKEAFTFHVGDCVSIFEKAGKDIDRVEGYFCASCLGYQLPTEWDMDGHDR